MSNLLTQSRLSVYRECKRKHRLMYIDGWRPVREGDALRFGALGHVGLAGWWGAPDGVDRLGAAFCAVSGRGEDAWGQIRIEEMLRGYDARWAGECDRYDVLLVEQAFTLPLLNPETMAASRTWVLAGKVDAIVRERSTGDLLLVEHKTTSDAISDPAASYWAKLAMDGQVSHYYLGSEGLGHKVHGCLYDVLGKVSLRQLKATPEASRKYNVKNGALYANQRADDETEDEYRARVRADIEAAPDAYFRRRMVARTEIDIREYLGDTWANARTMREDELAARAPRNPDACNRYGQCWAWDICAYGLIPQDHPERYQQLSDVHPELGMETTA